jgi:hypothetical protein
MHKTELTVVEWIQASFHTIDVDPENCVGHHEAQARKRWEHKSAFFHEEHKDKKKRNQRKKTTKIPEGYASKRAKDVLSSKKKPKIDDPRSCKIDASDAANNKESPRSPNRTI